LQNRLILKKLLLNSNCVKMFIDKVKHNLLNLPGWHTTRKILVIESDDWGSIRMPSKKTYQKFLDNGIRVDRDPYCKYDSLASKEDLEALFEVLKKVKDKNGRNAILTANSVVANPDFEKIKKSDFTQYHYEPFTETIKKSPHHDGALELWRQGMSEGIFYPQFHGREHVNIKKWLHSLQVGEEVTRLSFEFKTFGLTSEVDSRINNNYMGAFNSGLPEDIQQYNIILREGLDLFEKIFGYRSLSFIPTTYTWNPNIEQSLRLYGVKYLQGIVSQRIPLDDDTTFTYKNNNYQGTQSKSGLLYLMRNSYFEPSQNPSIDWVSNCLNRIYIAFRWNKPATISVHRLNFIGSIFPENRNQNLKLFSRLLNEIVKKWPTVEFMSSSQLGSLMKKVK